MCFNASISNFAECNGWKVWIRSPKFCSLQNAVSLSPVQCFRKADPVRQGTEFWEVDQVFHLHLDFRLKSAHKSVQKDHSCFPSAKLIITALETGLVPESWCLLGRHFWVWVPGEISGPFVTDACLHCLHHLHPVQVEDWGKEGLYKQKVHEDKTPLSEKKKQKSAHSFCRAELDSQVERKHVWVPRAE